MDGKACQRTFTTLQKFTHNISDSGQLEMTTKNLQFLALVSTPIVLKSPFSPDVTLKLKRQNGAS